MGELKKREASRQVVIFTPNPEQISKAARDEKIMHLLNQAQIALPDGVGLVMGARVLGKPIYARITGVDFVKKLCENVSKEPVVTGFLGGLASVAEEAAKCLKQKYPGLRVGYASGTYNKAEMIQSDIDILFVGLGFPKQEQWIMAHKDEIPAKILMAVGGSFDFISGRTPRAPKLVRDFGFEWVFRLIIQPWRFFRQLQILHFGALIFLEALRGRLKKLIVNRK